jgi:hypothetical protein
METEEIIHVEAPYQPTAEQDERAARLRRFNLTFVYLPIGLLAALVVVVVVIMLIIAVNPPQGDSLAFLSGLADVTLIIAICPMLLVGAGLLGLVGYIFSEARRRGTAPVRTTEMLLWRLDALAVRLRGRTESAASKVVAPLMTMHGAIAYVKSLITQFVGMVKRS